MSRNILPASAHADHAKPSSCAAPSPTVARWQPAKVKKLAGSACEYCRKRRRKVSDSSQRKFRMTNVINYQCNGEQPCPLCVDNHQECIYEIPKTETAGQAVKRKHAQMQQDHDELKALFNILATADSQKSLDIHNRIRAGQSPEFILQQLKHGDMLVQTKISSERHVRHVLLSSLMQTNASFDEMVEFVGSSIARAPGTEVPSAALLRQLRGKQTDLNGFRNLLGYPQPPPPQRRIAISDLLSDQASVPSETGSCSSAEDVEDDSKEPREPPVKVPAKPWTVITDDDDLVSHLISLYLEYVNPFFRALEDDLFVQAMQSGDLNSEYCSPFLVNSILGLACLYSEKEGAFFQPDDYITRGQHFHDEAFRLWHLEEGRASLTNLQALSVLYPGCILRGKDKLGVSTCAVLTQLGRSVPDTLHRPSSMPAPTPEEIKAFERARKGSAWAAFACDMATANTILQPAWHTTCKEDLPTLDELPSTETSHVWTGYPYHNKNDYLDKNAMWIAHCRLIQLTWKAQRLLYASDRSDPQFSYHVQALTEEMDHWKNTLPDSLQFRGRLPAPVYDLYSCYASVIIALYSLFRPLGNDRLVPSEETSEARPRQGYRYHQDLTPPYDTPDPTEDNTRDQFARTMSSRALATAHDHAVRLGSFRHHYGLKISPPYFVQANGVVCFTLLQNLDNPASAAAFKEAFRCLLGAGMQLLWARGMARMLHLTAQNTGIRLPKAIETMLEAVADTAWTKSDTEMLSSCWPNIAIAKDAKVGESVTMEDLIKKWEKLGVEGGDEKGRKSVG
ncbi:hypothetical protein E4T48_00472 [Aureobasidium sp. EXF-10727]|nr:hypothetical protein E4T48_00472 [Aureobasidium sp. EXF-10727]KAI4729683.1 hypothetical protein E4T49_02525 [Aureobasidium sp. EXF-10728]